ncbi:hypothetical protein Tsubulata_011050 [Turnera subulata]|uniref:3-hydroxyisobutyrate dehydrogenase-like NAD-binding domain-containing protein n=1 Tax=Turnera subulata TaxID=218843 RepID=A0A9Q0F600_9ROSI|nr:hypothetical protein Tsubulata_011050 [Turnera subulata]
MSSVLRPLCNVETRNETLVTCPVLCSVVNAFSERLVLAERSGLNPSNLLDVLDLGATAIPMFRVKGPAMPKSSYSCQFVISFKKAKSMGLGDLDFSAVYEILKASKE